jgi:glycerophosphoryl diester phosphodiesterase
MASRLPALRVPPVAFAHRGARLEEPENTLAAFRRALEQGATGLESDVWLTADGEPVLDHDGVARTGLRRRPLADLDRSQLPDHVPSLGELYADLGADFELSLDLKDPAAVDPVLAEARAADAADRLWLCHPDWRVLAELRDRADAVRLVESTRLRRMRDGPERRASELAGAGIDAVNLHHEDWTGGLTTLFHRFRLFTLGWDAQQDRVLDNLLDMGIDGVYSDHVDRMMAAIERVTA